MALNPNKPHFVPAESDELKVNDKVIIGSGEGKFGGTITKITTVTLPAEEFENVSVPAEDRKIITVTNSKGSIEVMDQKFHRIIK